MKNFLKTNHGEDRFFFQDNVSNNKYSLNNEESNHIAKVLRLKTGDRIWITNGKGLVQLGILTLVCSQKCSVEIIKSFQQPEKAYTVHIAIAPTKQISRIEWFTEKITEIGVDQLSFLCCQHSERQSINIKRLKKKAISALKQSQQAWLPTFNPIMQFNDIIASHPPGLIAHADNTALPLKKVVKQHKNHLVLIGPEGGFSTQEVDMAKEKGFQVVSLGDSRLRTETAGLIACHALNFIHQ